MKGETYTWIAIRWMVDNREYTMTDERQNALEAKCFQRFWFGSPKPALATPSISLPFTSAQLKFKILNLYCYKN